jgi:hypothetical protein
LQVVGRCASLRQLGDQLRDPRAHRLTSDALLEFAFGRASRHTVSRAVLCWPPDMLASMSWLREPRPVASVQLIGR